jgi:alkylation response protein AidB-like acyl-CoA dehydrogenase
MTMLKRTPADQSTAEVDAVPADCIARARAVAPAIAAASERIERERALPGELLSALHEARMFRMLIPRSYGGDEADPLTFFEAMQVLGGADASTAWCIGQGSGGSMAAAYLAPEVARRIFGDASAVVASGPSPVRAKAIAVPGGYRVTGHWSYASGSRHATWMGGHAIVCEADGSPRMGPNGKPLEARTMLFPRASASFEDVWQVMGLKGTGTDNYSVADVFVPEEQSFTRESAADRREAGPLYRFSIFSMFGVGFAGVALGIARVTLDEFIALAGKKTPAQWQVTLRDNASIQSMVGLAEARLQSGRALVRETFRDLWSLAPTVTNMSLDHRLRMRMATCFAIQQAKDVVDACYHAAGASAIFEKGPFERRFRDMHAVTQQTQGQFGNFELVGQGLLGFQPEARL